MLKYTEGGQDRRSKYLDVLRQRVKKIKKLDSYKDSEEWRLLKEFILDLMESHKAAQRSGIVACAVGGYWDRSGRELKRETDSKLVSDLRLAYEQEQLCQLIIDVVEKSENQIGLLNAKIEEVANLYKTAKEQLGD